MIVGGYSLDLYCDSGNPKHNLKENYHCDLAQFAGYDRAGAVRQARRSGWTINWHTQEARCPLCRNYRTVTTAEAE